MVLWIIWRFVLSIIRELCRMQEYMCNIIKKRRLAVIHSKVSVISNQISEIFTIGDFKNEL